MVKDRNIFLVNVFSIPLATNKTNQIMKKVIYCTLTLILSLAFCGSTCIDFVTVTGVDLDITTKTVPAASATTFTLTASVKPFTATNKEVTWKSSNTSVATVTKLGYNQAEVKVPAGLVAGSTATITVTTEEDGYKATCVVTVGP